MKKMMLLALAGVSALLALPAFASANPPLHVSATGSFTVEGGASKLLDTEGDRFEGKKIFGSGTFETTTTGTVELTFSEVSNEVLGACENVKTTKLPFHLTTLAGDRPGILITSVSGHYASFKCNFITVNVTGNGILGTITSPSCSGSSTTAKLSFKSAIAGHQQHTTITGVKYGLTSIIFGVPSPASLDAEATIKFPASRTLTCT